MKSILVAAAACLISVGAHAQALSQADRDLLFERYAAPRLEALSMVAVAERCQVFSNLDAGQASLYYRLAKDGIGADLSRYAMSHLGRWGSSEVATYEAAVAKGVKAATPAVCAKLRDEPEAALTLKQLVLSYAP